MTKKQPIPKGQRPISKATTHLLEQLRRKTETRNLNRRFLIVCEDGKSAPQYFRALKKHLQLSATSIAVHGNRKGSTQPDKIVGYAIELSKAAESQQSGTEPFDEVWCLIDGDYGSKIAVARSLASTHKNLKLAISTQCFEFWIHLHFQDTAPPHGCCDDVVRMLKASIPNYDKGSCEFDDIVVHHGLACTRAKQKRDHTRLAENQNPCSEVYMVISAIKDSMAN